MSRRGRSPVVVAVLGLWLFLSIVLQPLLAQSGSVDKSEVQHSVGIFPRRGGGFPRPKWYTPDQNVRALVPAAHQLMLWRKYYSPVHSRSMLVPKFGMFRGRKMLFGAQGCASQDLTLTQGPISSTSGIPTFSVQIINLCGTCAMGAIHVACGNWASATPVDPFIFSRLGYNDCLVNNGKPLISQGSISFQYSNSAMYPMSITSASNECEP